MQDASYWAGFFDGEGCVSIALQPFAVQISITQKDRFVLDLAAEQFGGRVHRKDKKHNHCHHWRLCGAMKIKKFFQTILPFSIVKKREIDIGLEAVNRLRIKNVGCNPLSFEEIEVRQAIREKLFTIRSHNIAKGSTSLEQKYRLSIKEKFGYRCSRCEKDLKSADPFDVIISGDALFCRSCNRTRFNFAIKPIPKEVIEETLKDSTLDEACRKLGVSRSSLYKKRKKYGLSLRREATIHA